MPLVKKLVDGENGLLFTYGVTGSGKTYTMTGPPGGCGAGGEESVGVMPRCLDLLFNSLQGRMAHPRTFRPDRLNGFELQSEVEALAERQREFIASITASKQNKL
ncbi:hypothetical protein AAG570_005894 [Ranatra chinensis]|uniref:Kinesin motor domain-containing protein n=1 Tax=Ranatra chinensis TaxID=642074 RepID=A0ABD0YI80_9HEMI